MTSQHRLLAIGLFFVSVIGTGQSVAVTKGLPKYTCKTFGSGVFKNFYDKEYYLRSSCRFVLTQFTHNNFDCSITIQRDKDSLLISQVEIIIDRVKAVLEAGSIKVNDKSISLPYDQTYLQVFNYGIYKRLKSLLLPFTVTWQNVDGGIGSLWLEIEQELKPDIRGLCSNNETKGELVERWSKQVRCSFFHEIAPQCKNNENSGNIGQPNPSFVIILLVLGNWFLRERVLLLYRAVPTRTLPVTTSTLVFVQRIKC
ncbi:hypothetical protein OJAV_G00205910 [Oryzias javanicus]|uniref:VWFD domain-containing protein n=1 Tax=Oryzias javanicus TaxID=123683 RepID=A0A3S2P5V0_ORYJA|nr:hypothetical protein OJAV_G00205910 [Oryzias javanicus]